MGSDVLLASLSAVILTSVLLYLLSPAAKHLRLVDLPDNGRKRHKGAVPLTGGLALFVSLLVVFTLFGEATPPLTKAAHFWPVIGPCLAALVLLHAVDDIIALRAITRFLIDAALALFICLFALVQLTTLGDLFGIGEVTLGRYAILMTLFCFIAASNAFNMTDGIDSLCTGLGIICFATIVALIMLTADASQALVPPLVIIIGALVPMYLANLGLLGPRMRTFLGDSGARLIGFMAAIALICAAQQGMIRPVVAFFPIAVPVCDCLVLMGWRLAHKRSPLSADRLHLHHLLQDAGFNPAQTRHAILTLAVAFSACGIAFEWSKAPTWVISTFVVTSFCAFIAMRLWLAARSAELTARHAIAAAQPAPVEEVVETPADIVPVASAGR